jgi:hypothetical protein
MNTTTLQDAALTALTVLADYLAECPDPGYTADPDRLLTSAEMACDHHDLPEDEAPAVTAMASFWIALASGREPARPGYDETVTRNLAGLPDSPSQQVGALALAAQMFRIWLACLTPAARHPHADADLDNPWASPTALTHAPARATGN